MVFKPKEEYTKISDIVSLDNFDRYPGDYVTRPPYQRKTVWSRKKKQNLLDSLLRRYYVPNLVFRQVRLTEDATVDEVIDGQQRITTIQSFYKNEFPLPKSLNSLSEGLGGTYYSKLSTDHKRYIDSLKINIDRILNIDEKNNPSHQRVATEIFWRLQQGESLNAMEIAHARLASRIRNFVVKYADDITFDYESYKPVDQNPSKHRFFEIIKRGNTRMEHLALLARMVRLEQANDYTDLKDTAILEMIKESETENGIGDESFENEPAAKTVIKNLSTLSEVFKDDPMLKDGGVIEELNREYFILSCYLLIRHLNAFYVVTNAIQEHISAFLYEFHRRWRANDSDDSEIARFSDNRQQGATDLRERDIILRHSFFKYIAKHGMEITALDSRRAFNEAERISIYRKSKGICRQCVSEGKPEKETFVSWADFQADHIVAWIKGGPTNLDNAQLLCTYHNQSKGAS